ncbi:F-box domain-containing protein [Mycena venus]|uniref:F-box domain-containing protein n=1 Tax=Mycena venus TaxID=2733690 RepID=A0A8H7CTA1_9AGAR|nr:F-box domain-containing protein [Mycena venus]
MSGSVACANCGNLSVRVLELLQHLLEALVPSQNESTAPNHLLKTNEPPVEAEMNLIHEIIASEENRIRVLDENIAHVESVLAVLSQQRDESKEKIRRHAIMISSLRHFPPEILGRIFLLTLPPTDEIKKLAASENGFGIGASPWVLTRVCSRWRKISLSFPFLWSNVILPPLDVSKRRPYPLDMLNTQLMRSGNVPLSIVVQNPEDLPQDVLTALLSSSSRWESLTFPRCGSFRISFTGRVPLLRKICVPPAFEASDRNSHILDAPALHDIFLGAYPAPLIFPWAQITRYQASGTWNEHVEVLPLMVNLVECHLWMKSRPLGGPPATNRTVNLPTLRKLCVRGGAMIGLANHENLVVPALQDLFVNSRLHHIFPWLQRSQCQLRRLAVMIDEYSPFPALIDEFLQQSPSITDITITTFSRHPREFLRMLPNLRRIAIYAKSFALDEIRDLIQSRRTAVSDTFGSLSFGVFASSVLDSNMKSAMKKFNEEGLDVRIEAMELKEWYSIHGWEQPML